MLLLLVEHSIDFNTNIDHGFNRITAVSIASSGTGYGTQVDADYYNAN